jgi:hypothetical protein
VSPRRTTSLLGPAIVGAVLAFAGHILAVGTGIIVSGFVPSTDQDDGEASIGAFWIGVLGMEMIVLLACLIGGVVLIARDRQGLGVGLLLGWPISLLVGCLFLLAQGSRSF